ncbi:hypothetical protein [Budvicia aquatica]|uniref:hypothetical protein n=1 Tax=Budvicia aquatica TaxID=82979 RepID=UPI00207DC2D1|nr:hypothetical protein [Budvicia aquatica]GKX50327.1 hypothetical protein SOASR029_06360 [Budvicia aquatica]
MPVYIRRELRVKVCDYSEQIILLKRSAELLGNSEVQFEMDTLNSYGDEGKYDFGSITLEQIIPIRDIFYCSSLIGKRPHHSNRSRQLALCPDCVLQYLNTIPV